MLSQFSLQFPFGEIKYINIHTEWFWSEIVAVFVIRTQLNKPNMS